MKQKAVVQITIFDETGVVQGSFIEVIDGAYSYEVERDFEKLGEKVAAVVDPVGWAARNG